MNFFRVFLFIYLISLSNNFHAKLNNISNSNFKNPLYWEYKKSSFNLKLYQSFGIRHFSWDLDLNYQFRQYFSVGIGNGFHRNKYPIFSTSDKHVLKLWSYPLYITGNVFLFANENRAFYIYGKYGRQFGLNTKGVKHSEDFKPIIIEGGLGYQITNRDRKFFLEIGQYYTTARGTFYSTYNSTINYDLEIYTIAARIGFKF